MENEVNMKGYKRALILTGNLFHFDFSETNVDIKEIHYKIPLVLRILRRMHFGSGLPGTGIWYGKWVKSISVYDFILVDDALFNLNIFEYIRAENKHCRLIFFHLTTFKSLNLSRLDTKKFSCEEWSFDKGDCKKYGWRYNVQFFNHLTVKKYESEIDVFFVGLNKNRIVELINLKNLIESSGFSTKFIIVKDQGKIKRENINAAYQKYLTNKFVPYKDIVSDIKKSKCILEINQKGQIGLTRRTLEAIFYSKKLITNNKDIMQYNFYNKNNIFILGRDDMEGLQKFLQSPYEDIPCDIAAQYTYRQWIENFFEHADGVAIKDI